MSLTTYHRTRAMVRDYRRAGSMDRVARTLVDDYAKSCVGPSGREAGQIADTVLDGPHPRFELFVHVQLPAVVGIEQPRERYAALTELRAAAFVPLDGAHHEHDLTALRQNGIDGLHRRAALRH